MKPSKDIEFEWLGPAEAVLRRPDMYVGTVEPQEERELLFDDPSGNAVTETQWTLSPIFRKIFDEVFVNALDAATRDDTLRKISVSFERTGKITVENDGRGIPVKPFKDTGRLIPEVVFSELNAGSNFEDAGKRLGGGRNGVGVVCANVWSINFAVEVNDGENQVSFRQEFRNNMSERDAPQVHEKTGKRRGSVKVEFIPDYRRLGIHLDSDDDCYTLLRRLVGTRCREGAVCVRRGVAVVLDGKKLPDSLTSYASALLGTPAALLAKDEAGSPSEACLSFVFGKRTTTSDGNNVGFVNGVRCSQGAHMKHLSDRLCRAAQARAPKGVHVRPQTVKDVLGFVAVCRIPDPSFSGQAKELLTTPSKAFGFTYEEIAARSVLKLQKQGLFEDICRRETERDIASSVRKTQVPKTREVLVDKYDPALCCKTDPEHCTLILTEGDSAKALVVAGLSVVGRDHYGVFPLRGVPLNVRNIPTKKCFENKEIANVLRILNLAPGRSLESLRYGRVAIMSDQDLDGSHIAALIINFIHCLVPEILRERPGFLCRIVTPLLRATHSRTGDVKSFFSQQELDLWLASPERAGYKLKYYKGLGTNSALEAKEIFSDLDRHTVTLTPTEGTDAAVLKFFDENKVAERKKMLTVDYDPSLCVDYSAENVGIDAFLNREVVHFSQYHVHRALASAIDGLTPARRKVLFYFLGLPQGKELRVAQAAAGVSQKTCYHHGEASLVECIVGSAQDHVGTNNVALLEPLGQFGSRHDKPSVHAAARYIYTRAAPIARCLFPVEDGPVLDYCEEEGNLVEPAHYVPVIPTVLLNGATGIGTGFSTSVPCFSLLSLCRVAEAVASWTSASAPAGVSSEWPCHNDLERAVSSGELRLPELQPHYEDFCGQVQITGKGVQTTGSFERDDDFSLTVTELPIGRWTETFMSELKGGDSSATPAALRSLPPVFSVLNLSTDTRVKVRITFAESIADIPDSQIASAFRLSTTVASTFMYLFDADEHLRKFESFQDILLAHSAARLRLYCKRKEYQLRELRSKRAVLEQKALFVQLIVDGDIELRGQSEEALVSALEAKGLLPLGARSSDSSAPPSFEHLLDMSFRACTADQIDKLKHEGERCREALEALECKSLGEMWREDIQRVVACHEVYLRTHRARHADGPARKKATAVVGSSSAPKAGRKKVQRRLE